MTFLFWKTCNLCYINNSYSFIRNLPDIRILTIFVRSAILNNDKFQRREPLKMKTLEYTRETGNIKSFKIWEELDELVSIPASKPSSLMVRTKKGRKAIAALKELEKNHNHSWYQELKVRSYRNPNATALFYRGTKITFKEMFEKADIIAKSLKEMGIREGDEIPACLSNTPELVYILLAVNKIGAKINLFGAQLDKDYIEEILDGCTDKLFLGTDDVYKEIKDIIEKRNYKNRVLTSLSTSLPKHPESLDGYEPELEEYYHYDNLALIYKDLDDRLLTFEEMYDIGKNSSTVVVDNNDLDTEFLITYTSGSTKKGRPKQLVHSNRSLITSGRFHDSELSGNPKLEGLRGLAHIHTDSNTDVITCISDNLMQLWSVGLEPEYDKKKAIDYVMLNKPNYLNATTSFLVEMSKQYLIEKKFHQDGVGRKFDFLLAAFAVGEGTSKGEEKFINTFLRKSRAGSGVKIAGLSMPFTTLSVGGGDCEHGGIYYSLWRSLYEKLNYLKLSGKEYGMMPVPYAQVTALKLNSCGQYEECDFNEKGILVANSATTMVRYKNNKEATENMIIRDSLGRDWVTLNVYGYIDELGGAHVKGRVNNEIMFPNGEVVLPYQIEDEVSKDTKNILSCTVTQAMDCGQVIPVLNIELQPFKRQSDTKILSSALSRCAQNLPNNVAERCVFRLMNNRDSFPLIACGKRSSLALEEMGLENTFKIYNGRKIPYGITRKLEKEKILEMKKTGK